MHFSGTMCAVLAIVVQLAIVSAFPQAIPPKETPRCRQGGPDYWCQNYDTVLECDAVDQCGRLVDQQTGFTFDPNQCTFGPSFWCTSFQTAVKCGQMATQFCRDQQNTQRVPNPIVGDNRCTQGGAYWCQSPANAIGCGEGAFAFCMEQTEKSVGQSPPVLGADPCTFGPSAICQSFESMRKCRLSLEVCKPHLGSGVGTSLGSSLGSTPIVG